MRNVLRVGLIFMLPAQATVAWGPEGHRVIARIAAKHLSPRAQAHVRALLAADLRAGPLPGSRPASGDALAEAMAEAATWADAIKNKALGAGTNDWHFLDLAGSDGAPEIGERCPNNNCVTGQLRIMTANLKAGGSLQHGSNTYSLGEQLKFIIHFMGDLHQPLHCATNADAGGNCLSTHGFGEKELHATWDTGLVKELLEDSQDHKISESTLASALDAEFASQFTGSANLTDFDQMALESHDTAFQVAYGPMIERGILPRPEPRPFLRVSVSRCATEATDFFDIHPPVDLTAVYNGATLDAVRGQLAKAGYRLAVLLNNTLQ